MLHLRIVAPEKEAKQVLELFSANESVCNLIHLPGAAQRPKGDVVLADVAREDASVLISDLRELEIPQKGSIAIEEIDTEISEASRRAEKAAPGAPSDAVDRRRALHLRDPSRNRAGLPVARSRRGTNALSAAELGELERTDPV